jgi:hypothetical protein
MNQKEIITAPKADAIIPSGVFGKPFVCGALYFNIMKEVWKGIDGFDNYQISNTGLVKSIQRKIMRFNGHIIHKKTVNERILKPAISGSGYEFVTLRKNNQHYAKRIHQLVASHFIKGQRDGLVVHHKDGNKLNNYYSNLEYISMQKNTKYYYNSIGKSTGKVPISDIGNIINRIDNGESCYKIAEQYNVTRNDISVLCKIIALTGEELTISKTK